MVRDKENLMKRLATACALAGLPWLSCAGSGNPKDTGIPVPDADIHVNLPDVQLTPVDTNPANPGGCHCSVVRSPCPDGASSCLDCAGSPAWCSQCPIPTDPPQACTTLFFRCDYSEAQCDCVPSDGGTGIWSCMLWLWLR
jgi:hypothetical protein